MQLISESRGIKKEYYFQEALQNPWRFLALIVVKNRRRVVSLLKTIIGMVADAINITK